MSVTPSAPVHELSPSHAPVAAIVYPDDAYPYVAFETLVRRSRERGLSLAGVLQHRIFEAADRRCDLVLEDLTTGHCTAIFQDRGTGAAGCRLDEAALAEAAARIEANLDDGPDLMALNKFGKAECGGGGLLDLIANAIDRKIPVVIGVPASNLGAWRNFAGEFAVEVTSAVDDVERWLGGLR